MKLKEVAKIGVIVSILLFCLAVGSFEFIRLTDTDKSHEFDLYSLVPNDCIALLESDNLNFFISDYEEISFLKELHNFQNASISHLFFHRLMESNTENKHGISNLISRILISYSPAMSDDGEVLYVRTNNEGKRFIEYILENDSNKRISPKKEKYRKKNILIYPLLNGQFLATFKDDGFYVMSFQKNLIEQIIDTYSDMNGIDQDEILKQARENKKAHNYLTLYSRFSFMPMLNEEGTWHEYDFHINSEVVYLSGETYFRHPSTSLELLSEKLNRLPTFKEDSLVVSAHHDSITSYINEKIDEQSKYPLFQQCVSTLSPEASYIMVTDMNKVKEQSDRYTSLLSEFILERARKLQAFILSAQLSIQKEKLSHILVLTYKE